LLGIGVAFVVGNLGQFAALAQNGQLEQPKVSKISFGYVKPEPLKPAPLKPAPVKPKSSKTAKELAEEGKAALAEGKALYRGLCSGCHGGAGRGGKGPNLTDDRWLHGDKDEDIARVIYNGVPRTTMKQLGESLKKAQIAKLIAYIRSLARAPGNSTWKPYLTGDSQVGKQLFFDQKGKALCAKCHTVARKGGRVGPALDRIASRRSHQYIMESILLSSKEIDPRYQVVQVVTQEGKVIVGLRVNETNFSIQLREENGRFHSFLKRELEDFRVLKKSLMPDNYSQQLNVKELHDIFAYVISLD
jgi:putative heme-binding domain-containing protein